MLLLTSLAMGLLGSMLITPPTADESTLASSSITPFMNSRPPRVTTNEGRASLVISVPCSTPNAPVAARPARIAIHHGRLTGGAISSAMMKAPTAAV